MQTPRAFSALHSSVKQYLCFQISFPARRAGKTWKKMKSMKKEWKKKLMQELQQDFQVAGLFISTATEDFQEADLESAAITQRT